MRKKGPLFVNRIIILAILSFIAALGSCTSESPPTQSTAKREFEQPSGMAPQAPAKELQESERGNLILSKLWMDTNVAEKGETYKLTAEILGAGGREIRYKWTSTQGAFSASRGATVSEPSAAPTERRMPEDIVPMRRERVTMPSVAEAPPTETEAPSIEMDGSVRVEPEESEREESKEEPKTEEPQEKKEGESVNPLLFSYLGDSSRTPVILALLEEPKNTLKEKPDKPVKGEMGPVKPAERTVVTGPQVEVPSKETVKATEEGKGEKPEEGAEETKSYLSSAPVIYWTAESEGETTISLVLTDKDGNELSNSLELNFTIQDPIALVKLQKEDKNYKAGDQVILELYAENLTKFYRGNFKVWFDPSITRFVSAELGPYFPRRDEAFLFTAAPSKDSDFVNISIALKQGVPEVTYSSGTIARVTLSAETDFEGSLLAPELEYGADYYFIQDVEGNNLLPPPPPDGNISAEYMPSQPSEPTGTTPPPSQASPPSGQSGPSPEPGAPPSHPVGPTNQPSQQQPDKKPEGGTHNVQQPPADQPKEYEGPIPDPGQRVDPYGRPTK